MSNDVVLKLLDKSPDTILKHCKSTDGYVTPILGVFRPTTNHEVQAVLHFSNQEKVKIWPISSGRNFGYGTSQGKLDAPYYILDLSLLKEIKYEGNGIVTIEAGVTQKDLYDFLIKHNLSYLVPITGAGPDCSLIGNAVDGGYGQTPITDHFDAFLKFSGFWGSSEPMSAGFFYQSKGFNEESVPLEWQHGIGLNIKSILRQTGLCVITSGVLKLHPIQEGSQIIILKWASQDSFIHGQTIIKEFLNNFPISTALSMNSLRSLASMPGIPVFASTTVEYRQRNIQQLEADYYMAPWTTVLPVFGDAIVTAAAVKYLKKLIKLSFTGDFKSKTPTVINLSLNRINKLNKILTFALKLAPEAIKKIITPQINSLVNLSSILTGTPNPAFLKLAYTFFPDSSKGEYKNPAFEKNLGLYWFAPVLPVDRGFVMQYIADVKTILIKNGFDPLLAFTAKSAAVATSITPILFDKEKEEDIQRAHNCLKELFAYVKSKNICLYRVSPELYPIYDLENSERTVQYTKLQLAFDPNNILVSKYIVTK